MTDKTVFQYDLAGYLVGGTIADESPLEPGVWHMPARTTAIAPPEHWPDDKWPRWDSVGWQLVSKPIAGAANDHDPVAKLQAFLAANPDVAALL